MRSTASPAPARVLLAFRDERVGTLPALLEACGVAVTLVDPERFVPAEAGDHTLVVQEVAPSGGEAVAAVEAVRAGGARLIAVVDVNDPGFVCDLYRAGASVVFNRSVGAYHIFLQCCAFLQIWQTEDGPTRLGSAMFEPGPRRLLLDGGGEVHLTEAETKILAMLAANLDRYVGRGEISETVFRIPYDKFDRRIDVHVSNLRKKFRQHGIDAVIDTSRLNGFRLVVAAAGDVKRESALP